MINAEIGAAIGAAGLALAIIREWIAAGERRRARPVVVVHEVQGRHAVDEHNEAVSVYLTNESAASAFNVRFGVRFRAHLVAWKHDLNDPAASRINVLRPGQQYPPDGSINVVGNLARVMAGDVDEDRSYWAYYQSPAGDWWFTDNPVVRSENLRVKRLGTKTRRVRSTDFVIRILDEVRMEARPHGRLGPEPRQTRTHPSLFVVVDAGKRLNVGERPRRPGTRPPASTMRAPGTRQRQVAAPLSLGERQPASSPST
jgi:hypothetical protein